MDQNPPAVPQNTKQQIVDILKNATNVLVTVSANPSVDQLASCIGLTLMLNKLEKHCTAVFSGQVPSTIEFLQPEKTLEQNTDSLRDFIISLDRNKADKLRYKIEDNIVKIFITPYRTSLSEADLQYSQGDYNVDVVVALGVDKREHLDQAITAHGRILHDATVVGISCGAAPTVVGSINWHDSLSSSLSEMLVSVSESFQSGILDTQMATAFLTGIVAQTERFSNDKTSPKVMTMSAQLMASGANQQLIATQLNSKPSVPVTVSQEPEKSAEFSVPHTEQPILANEAPPSSIKPEAPVAPEGGVEKRSGLQEPSTRKGLDSLAPAVEEGGVNSPEDALSQIDIDRAGHLHDISPTGQLEEETRQAKAENQSMQPRSNHEKVIAPLSSQPNKPTSNYIFEPPSNGGTFTASINDDAEKETAPFASGPGNTPILTHDHPAETKAPDAIAEDSARQAVINAVSSADYKPLADSPAEALNAQTVDLGGQPEKPIDPVSSVNPNIASPPIVPPPIVMPPPASNDPTDITMPTPE